MKLRSLIIISVLIAQLGCSKEDPKDERVIEDAKGLIIELEWDSGGSASQALNDIDLDLFLKKGSTQIESSVRYGSFEDIALRDFYADDEYVIEIRVYSAQKDGTYELFVKGVDSGDTRRFEGTISSSETGASIQTLTIRKQGRTYTLIR
jgi:hypothetical protein